MACEGFNLAERGWPNTAGQGWGTADASPPRLPTETGSDYQSLSLIGVGTQFDGITAGPNRFIGEVSKL